MTARVAAVLLLAACTTITGDFSPVVAILYTGPAAPAVDEADTLTLTAVALDGGGNPLPDHPVVWRVFDTATPPFTLDTLTGLVTGVFGGSSRVRGTVDGLSTNLITVTIRGIADSIAAEEPSVIAVDTGAATSAPLVAIVYDIPPGRDPRPLAGQDVRFTVVQPAPGTPEAAQIAIAPPGTEPGTDSLVVTVQTGGSGLASVTARRIGAVQPDTAVIEAVALTPSGAIVPGTPARFLVLFAAAN